MKKKLIVWSGLVLGLAPIVALAQFDTGTATGSTGILRSCGNANVGNLFGVLCKFDELLTAVLPVLIGLGVVYFVWGVITYVISSDEEAKKAGRDRIIYGIIGLAVIIGLWGLVRILTDTFSISNTRTITLPTVPF